MARLSSTFPTEWPPGLTASAIRHCPPSLRDDAIQAAWLARAEGRKPDSAVRALLRHEERHAAEKPDFHKVERIQRRF